MNISVVVSNVFSSVKWGYTSCTIMLVYLHRLKCSVVKVIGKPVAYVNTYLLLQSGFCSCTCTHMCKAFDPIASIITFQLQDRHPNRNTFASFELVTSLAFVYWPRKPTTRSCAKCKYTDWRD